MDSFPCNDQHCLTLFIHGNLPIQASNFHPHLGSKFCPSCQREPKDTWHFFKCSNPEQKQLFHMLKTMLTALLLKYSLHPSILTVYWLGLLAIRSDTPFPNIQADLPPEMQNIVPAQTRLGWEQLYHGRLTKAWTAAIDYLHPHATFTGQAVMISFIKATWTYILDTWKLCNGHLHQNASALNLPDYWQAVIAMYKTKMQLPPHVQNAVFQWPLREMLDQPPHILWQWIIQSQKYISQQVKAAKKQAKLKTSDIQTFFCHLPNQDYDLKPPWETLFALNQCGSSLYKTSHLREITL